MITTENASQASALRMQWMYKYYGIPWVPGGRTFEGFDCWGLVRSVYLQQLDLDLPLYMVDPNKKLSVSRMMIDGLSDWHSLDEPKHMSLVVLSKSKIPSHVGIYIDEAGGFVFHSVSGVGVCADSLATVREQFKMIEFYEHGSLRNNRESL